MVMGGGYGNGKTKVEFLNWDLKDQWFEVPGIELPEELMAEFPPVIGRYPYWLTH